MASRNSIKSDVVNGYYHVYNRGVEKRDIFVDKQDYGVFLSYLKEYLSPPSDKEMRIAVVTFKDTVFKGVARLPNNYKGKVSLMVYALMPNHFHFILKQNIQGSMKEFVHSLLLRYSMYFNKKYKRVGPLFQGRYKAILVDNDSYLLHLSRYIHLNPTEFSNDISGAYSSYKYYLGLVKADWLDIHMILDYFKSKTGLDFKNINTYKDFVEKYSKNNVSFLQDLVLEDL